jgi:hypothetical protein
MLGSWSAASSLFRVDKQLEARAGLSSKHASDQQMSKFIAESNVIFLHGGSWMYINIT